MHQKTKTCENDQHTLKNKLVCNKNGVASEAGKSQNRGTKRKAGNPLDPVAEWYR